MADTTKPRPFVFVLMPFSPEFDDTYRLAIKPACDNAGAYAERVDEQIFDGGILDRIYNQIAKADVVVADVTGKNPNVFYETGYAHALGKRTLLLTQTVEDIPFDLKHFPHIVYGGRLSTLLPELERRLRWYIDNPEKMEPTQGNIFVRVNSIPLEGENPGTVFETSSRLNGVDLTIEVHNSVGRELRTLEGQVGIISPETFEYARTPDDVRYLTTVRLANDQNLHLLDRTFRLFPGRWETIELTIFVPTGVKPSDKGLPFAVRVFTESGYFDFPFAVIVEREEGDRSG